MKRRLKLALSAFTKPHLAFAKSAPVEVRPRPSAPPLYIATGRTYRARNGARIGPLRPFRDEEDGPHKDRVGRSAWFYAEGIGPFDRFGHFLSGQAGESPLDCVADWKPGQIIVFDQLSVEAPLRYSH